jgi:hypothetical protein
MSAFAGLLRPMVFADGAIGRRIHIDEFMTRPVLLCEMEPAQADIFC